MTKKECAYIEARANQFFRWGEEELEEAEKAETPEEHNYHFLQATLNACAGNALMNVLSEIASMKGA